MDARDIILRPLISEKSTSAMTDNKYTFEIHVDANKSQVKKAIEEIFKVKVTKVNTINIEGKMRRYGKFTGKRPDRKKAIVTLAEGQSIKVFEGA